MLTRGNLSKWKLAFEKGHNADVQFHHKEKVFYNKIYDKRRRRTHANCMSRLTSRRHAQKAEGLQNQQKV